MSELSAIRAGILNTLSTFGNISTPASSTPPNKAILRAIEAGAGLSLRTITISGTMPKPRRSFKAFCAGLLLNSLLVPINGTYTTCAYKQCSLPTL